jgi:ATP-dependent Clp protease protease subunit
MKRPPAASEFNVSDRVDSTLLENRTHFLSGEIDEENIEKCIKWILYENFNATSIRPLTLYINSTGGDLYSSFALIDVMKHSVHPIHVIGVGSVMSAALLIFASGEKGHRYAMSHTSFMCHQYSDEMQGKHHDLKASMAEGERCNSRMIDILQQATGLVRSKIKSQLLRPSDTYMSAEEALKFNIADSII